MYVKIAPNVLHILYLNDPELIFNQLAMLGFPTFLGLRYSCLVKYQIGGPRSSVSIIFGTWGWEPLL